MISEEKNNSINKAQSECLKLLIEIDQICKDENLVYWLDGGTLLGAIRHQGFIPWDDDIDICFPLSSYEKLLPQLKSKFTSHQNFALYHFDYNYVYWVDCFSSSVYLRDGVFPISIDLIPVKILPNDPNIIETDKSLVQIAQLFILGESKFPERILDEHRNFIDNKNLNSKGKASFFRYYFDFIRENELKTQTPDSIVSYIFDDGLVKRERNYYKHKDVFPLTKHVFSNLDFNIPNNANVYLTELYGSNYMEIPPLEKRITHLTKLYLNDFKSKKRSMKFVNDLYKISFWNLDLRNKGKFKQIKRIVSLFYMIINYTLVFKYTEIKALLRYINIRK